MKKLIISVVSFFLIANIAWAAPKAGDKAPVFSLITLDGKKVSLDDFKGKVVLIGMFHICVPCMQQALEFQKVRDSIDSDKLVVLGINTSGDSKADVSKYISGFPGEINFPYLLDPDMTIHKSYIQRDMPTVLIIDPNGNIQARTPNVSADQLTPYLKKLL
ncbi:MAG: peroxiredoxin family protein [Nitrospinales bacterium]